METSRKAPTPLVDPRTSLLDEKAFKSRTVLLFGTITDVTAQDTAVPRERGFCLPQTRLLIHPLVDSARKDQTTVRP